MCGCGQGSPWPVSGQAWLGSPAWLYLCYTGWAALCLGLGNTWISPYKASELLREPRSCPSASRLRSATLLKRQFLAPASPSGDPRGGTTALPSQALDLQGEPCLWILLLCLKEAVVFTSPAGVILSFSR